MSLIKKRNAVLLSFLFFFASIITVSAQEIDVRRYGAKGDGKTKNTTALQKAIDLGAKTGAVVLIPKGVFLTGSLALPSGITLKLMKGAVLLGSTDLRDYPLLPQPYESYTNGFALKALLHAEGAENITITGEGTIDGQGNHEVHRPKTRNANDSTIVNRPYVIKMVQCKKIKVEGIRLQHSVAWMQHYLACEDLVLRGLDICNHGNFNNDGIDIDNCRNVVISDCIIDADDDALCLKSTSPADRCEYITITNCIIASNCNGFKAGTDSQGGFANITLSNCVFRRSNEIGHYRRKEGLSAIALEIVDGGLLEGVLVSNVSVTGYGVPVFLRLGNRARTHKEGAPVLPVGKIRDVQIHHLTAVQENKSSSAIAGIPEGIIENVIFSNWQVVCPGGGTAEQALYVPKEKEAQYPEYNMFGTLPSWGLYVRHARNIVLQNLFFRTTADDARPALQAVNTKNLQLQHIALPKTDKPLWATEEAVEVKAWK